MTLDQLSPCFTDRDGGVIRQDKMGFSVSEIICLYKGDVDDIAAVCPVKEFRRQHILYRLQGFGKKIFAPERMYFCIISLGLKEHDFT